MNIHFTDNKSSLIGLYVTGSMFNHACDSNVGFMCDIENDGRDMFFITSKDIHADEELTVSYFNPDLPVEMRYMIANAQYGFTCNCSKCISERPAK